MVLAIIILHVIERLFGHEELSSYLGLSDTLNNSVDLQSETSVQIDEFDDKAGMFNLLTCDVQRGVLRFTKTGWLNCYMFPCH